MRYRDANALQLLRFGEVDREEVKTPRFCFENSQLTAQPNRAEEGSKNTKQWRENQRCLHSSLCALVGTKLTYFVPLMTGQASIAPKRQTLMKSPRRAEARGAGPVVRGRMGTTTMMKETMTRTKRFCQRASSSGATDSSRPRRLPKLLWPFTC